MYVPRCVCVCVSLCASVYHDLLDSMCSGVCVGYVRTVRSTCNPFVNPRPCRGQLGYISHSEAFAFDNITRRETYPWPSVIKQQCSAERQPVLRFLQDATVYRKSQNKLASWTHYCGALTKTLQVPEMAKENGIYVVLKVVVFVVKTRLNKK